MAKKSNKPDTRGFSTSSVPKKVVEVTADEAAPTLPPPAPVVVQVVEPMQATINLDEIPEERVTLFRADAEHIKELKRRADTVANTIIPTLTLPERTEQSLVKLINLSPDHFLKLESTQETSLVKMNFAYMSLMKMEIHPDDIELAFTSTCSQILASLFDWLCVNVPIEQLPESLVDPAKTISQEIQFIAPDPTAKQGISNARSPLKSARTRESRETVASSAGGWILSKYSNDNIKEQEDEELSTNSKHAALKYEYEGLKKLLAVEEASAKKTRLRDEMAVIKDEMNIVSASRDFAPRKSNEEFKKLALLDEPIKPRLSSEDILGQPESPAQSASDSCAEYTSETEFDIFSNNEPIRPSQPIHVRSKTVLNLSFTKEQWSGKTPRQYFVDYLSKHSKNTKLHFNQLEKNGFEFRCGVKLVGGHVKFDGKSCEMSRDELCTTSRDAEFYVVTKIMFQLLGNMPIYRSLPPSYRDVWNHLDYVKKNAPVDDGGKSRRTAFLCQLVNERDGRIIALKESELVAKDVEIVKNIVVADTKNTARAFGVLSDMFVARLQKPDYLQMLNSRMKLPVYDKKSYVLDVIEKNQVVVISGETGRYAYYHTDSLSSGKTTQIPQFILEDALTNSKAPCNIVCTQPRRISAVSIATRVSQEMGDGKRNVGTRQSLIGYQIRLESKTSDSNRLTFCTTGVLLKRLETDTEMTGVTHLVIDEVHERTVDSDVLLLLVRNILSRRSDLKVILMSATAQSELFQSYFSALLYKDVPCISISGRTFPVDAYYLEDAIEHCKYQLEPNSEYSAAKQIGKSKFKLNLSCEESGSAGDCIPPSKQHLYSASTKTTLRLMNIYKINYELVRDLILNLSRTQSMEGSVLVFLPGFEEIKRMNALLSSSKREFKQNLLILVLHSSVDNDSQIKVFEPVAPGMIKIVLSTNIAETGVTIPDVVYVIDTCRAKEICFDDRRHVKRLREVFVSKASCMQRRGRAGRVQKGISYHLVPQIAFDDLPSHQVPEISRIPLEEVCLRLSVLGFTMNVSKTLSLAITPPPVRNVERSIAYLQDVDALDADERITPFGKKLALLPVDVRVGRILLYGIALQCLEPIAIIGAMLSLGSTPFTRPLGKESDADNAKMKFFSCMIRSNSGLLIGDSDLMSSLNAYQQWKDHANQKDFCSRCFLSQANLVNMWAAFCIRMTCSTNIKDQYIRTILGSGLGAGSTLNRSSTSPAVILTALGCGFYPNLVFTREEQGNNKKPALNALTFNEKVTLHPSSQLSERLITSTQCWYGYYQMSRTETSSSMTYLSILDLNRVDFARVLMCAGGAKSEHRRKSILIDTVGEFWVECIGRTGSVVRLVGDMCKEVVETRLGLKNMGMSEEEGEIFDDWSEELFDTLFESKM